MREEKWGIGAGIDTQETPLRQGRGAAAAGRSAERFALGGQPGLVAGTRVLTADGDLPVELLGPGDRIITRNAGYARLVALHFHQYRGDFVQIAAGALGDTRPETDTILAADQVVLLRGDAARSLTGQTSQLIRAADLPDFSGRSLLCGIEMTVVQMVFDAPQLVYGDGLETLCLPLQESSLAA